MAEQNLQTIAFPVLDAEQLASLEGCMKGASVRFQDGQRLFCIGDRDFKFYVVRSGILDIVDESGDQPKVRVTLKAGQFTGEISQLTGSPAIVSCVARGDCEVLEIPYDMLREILNQCPQLSDIIMQAFLARRQLLRASGDFIGLRVIGSRYSQDTFRVRDFLARNRAIFTWMDIEDNPEVQGFLEHLGLGVSDTPVVACAHRIVLRNPTDRELAEHIGARHIPNKQVYDLVVVGAGPAGLAAAVYGASEGLSTLVLERLAPGGQAGSSMRIENYLGFPMGLTGSDLTERAVAQANKFGVRLPVAAPVTGLSFDKVYSLLHLEDGETVTTKCLLIATGAQYRRLDTAGCEAFEGRGVYYVATHNELQMCRGADVVVVGGGNSAGQAVVFLANSTRKAYLILRGSDLYATMSSYLAKRIEQTSNIEILLDTTIRRMAGDRSLSEIEVVNSRTKEVRTLTVSAVFSFIGAVPHTDWLPPEIERDPKQFVRTGPSLAQSPFWTAKRHPYLLETTRPGVFAAGDVRSGSVKRVASAVGEGAMAVQFVHEYLKEM